MTHEETLQQLIERAAADPDFMARLAADPAGAAAAEGFTLSADDIQNFFNQSGISGTVEELKARVAHGGGGETGWPGF